MPRSELRRLPLPDLVNSAIVSLQTAQEALAVLAERIDPSLPTRDPSRMPPPPSSAAKSVEAAVPDWLRPIYDDLREQIMGLNHEIEARPSPMRNGQRRYEAFLLRGRNVIYAHFRRSFIRLNFELPPNHRLPAHEVVKSGERDFRRFELRSKDDLSGAVRLARETIAWVVAR